MSTFRKSLLKRWHACVTPVGTTAKSLMQNKIVAWAACYIKGCADKLWPRWVARRRTWTSNQENQG
ncbi:hypothetical protein, partial [Vibrio furnissii]|uniref:hypothetical protein n=1 Tax=Vibrio furnissii TaxID=29494 RepID=UPI001EEC540D